MPHEYDLHRSRYRLVDIHQDNDNAMKDELAALGGQTAATAMNLFYDKQKEIHECHACHPAAGAVDAAEDDDEVLKEEPIVDFSGEVLRFARAL